MSKKLSPQKQEIIRLIINPEDGISQVMLAELMGVSRSRINKIFNDFRKLGKEEFLDLVA